MHTNKTVIESRKGMYRNFSSVVKFREQSCPNFEMPEDVIYDRTHTPSADSKSFGNRHNNPPAFTLPENISWPNRTLPTTPVQPLPTNPTIHAPSPSSVEC